MSDEAPRIEPIDDEHAVRVTVRHGGRTYGVIVYASGSSSLDVDGRFVCNAHWNGRVLDTGHNEVHRDRNVSDRILARLAEGVREAQEGREGR